MVAILPLVGVGGSQLFKAETAGPLKEAKLTPRIADTAKGLWTVYAGLSVLCLLAYKGGGNGLGRCRGPHVFNHEPGWLVYT